MSQRQTDETQDIYILRIAGTLVAVSPSRWLYAAGQIVPIEGEDVFGCRYPINVHSIQSVRYGAA